MIVNNLNVTFDSKTILNNISFILNNNDKVGLVGVNGSGKSTLLKAISGNIKIDSGNINLNDKTIGYLKQEIQHDFDELSILDYIKKEIKIDLLEEKLHYLENNLNEDTMDEYSDVLNKYLALDGYSFEDNLKNIINGLKLEKNFNDKIKVLSGGEKIKVLISALLLKNTDILLLDEPTNNLDITAIEWLENYLSKSDKTILMVSHDEHFLNTITNKTFELNDGNLVEYNLKYNEYLIEKGNEYNKKHMEYIKAKDQQDKLKKQIAKAKEWANKGTSKKAHNDNDKIANNFAKEHTNSSNISKLTRNLNNLEIPDFDEKKPINFFFNFDDSKGKKDIILSDLICGYDNFKTQPINLNIPFGSRIQINGKNGSGKTTLIKTILKELKPLNGKIIIGSDVKIGYISQDTLFNENNTYSIIEYLLKDLENIDKSLVFILLDKFNISYDDKDKLYSTLSPGERTRVNLVKLALDKINILLLDEITNHLDKEAIDLIYELVESYNGTIISISHNRKFNEILDADIELNIENGNVEYKEKIKSKTL